MTTPIAAHRRSNRDDPGRRLRRGRNRQAGDDPITRQRRAWPATWDLGVDADGAPLTLARRRGEDGVAVYAIFRGSDQHGPGATELYGLTVEALVAIGGALSGG